MIFPGLARALSILLSFLPATSLSFGQPPQIAPGDKQQAPKPIASRLIISVLEGNNVINSMSLIRSVTPVVEVRDENDFPVEGATVIFTLPEKGPGGVFSGDRSSFTTRADSHGQAGAPFVVNNDAGKFQIKVQATAGNRKGEAFITQTNSTGSYVGVTQPGRPWYKKKKNLYMIAIGGGATIAAVIALTRGDSSSPTIVFAPGGPTFGGPR